VDKGENIMDKQELIDELRLALDSGDGDLDIIEQEIKNVICRFYGSHLLSKTHFTYSNTLNTENIHPLLNSTFQSLIS
jgi:hypothetical protein